MKFQIASDIHLEVLEMSDDFDMNDEETFRFIIEPEAPILILAGDITSLHAKCTLPFLNWCSKKFEHTFWIMGNHEYYARISIPKDAILENYRRICPNNVHILDNETYILENVLFVGSTLWSNISEEDDLEIQQRINDYRMIYTEQGRRICVAEVRAEFKKNLQFLEDTIASNPDKQIVIITHHAPLNKNTSFADYEGEVTNTAYATHIDLKNDSNVRYWIYGHTHHNAQLKKGNYTVMSNQFGYFGEHTGMTYEFSGVVDI
jgi:DNA repair exonuclease SbcCD nuclease subunit